MVKSSKFILFFMVLIAVCVQLFLFEQKEVFHIDELFSFALANGENGIYLYHNADEINDKALKGEVFRKYLTQGDNTSFSTMWHNLSGDTHMPLYFVLLRAVCSFFNPFVFTEVPGIIINILLLCGLLLSFYGLAKSVLKKDIFALLTLGVLTFSYAVLSLEIYIRMYLLQMFLSVLLVWNVVELLKKDKEIFGICDLIYLFLLVVLNILCHYYSIIFCFAVAFCGCLILLASKKIKQMFWVGCTMLLAVIAAYLIYPEMLKVGMYGERGAQFFALLGNLFDDFWEIFWRQFVITGETLFSNLYIEAVITGLCLYSFYVIKNKNQKCLMLFFMGVFVLYSFVVGLVMPRMVGFQIRYFAPVIPIGMLILVMSVLVLCKCFKIKKQYIYLFLVAGILFEITVALFRKGNTFYFIGTRESRKMERLVKNADIWWALGGGQMYAWIIHIYVDKLIDADEVWMLNDYDSEAFKKFAEDEKNKGKYAYLLLPKLQESVPEGAVEWVKDTTGRQAYYLFTVKNDKMSAMVFEASVFLVCPF
ncbi:MAG: hypothetical protein J6J35_01885 [Alphaproteobacteria bacterium]|nr:hypothetical protein [Alphaproteobacteria bacterium]